MHRGRSTGVPVGEIVEHLTGALVIAEDEPQAANRVTLDWSRQGRP